MSLIGTFPQKLEAIPAEGFDCIELFEWDFINVNDSAANFGRLTEDLSMSIDMYQPLRDFEGLPKPQFRRRLERAERKVDPLWAMGAPLVLCCFNTSPLTIDDSAGIVDIPGDKIFFLQMADAPLFDMWVLQWARDHRSFPAQGDFDVVTFIEKTLLAAYTGPLLWEIFNDVPRETPNRRTVFDAMRSLP